MLTLPEVVPCSEWHRWNITVIKIREFARLAHVSVVTLRHYDEIGLLKPVSVDRCTGYRYYSVAQLPRLNRILALKDSWLFAGPD